MGLRGPADPTAALPMAAVRDVLCLVKAFLQAQRA